MPAEIVRKTLKGSDFPMIDWQKEFKITPNQLFTITVHRAEEKAGVDAEIPPYDVPKKYSARVKNILKKAKMDLEEKKKHGYTREDAIKDFFEAQDKFAQHIEEQRKCR